MSVPVYQTTYQHITENPNPYADCTIQSFPNTLCCRNLFIWGGGGREEEKKKKKKKKGGEKKRTDR
jgi:hypothetical protein